MFSKADICTKMNSKDFHFKKKKKKEEKVVNHLQIIHQEGKEVKSHCLKNSLAFIHLSLVPKHKAILSMQSIR